MTKQLYRSTGLCLALGSLLIIATMVLHPAGGDIPYLISIAKMLKTSHTIGIVSVPVALFGFYGLSKALQDKLRLSTLAFIIIAFGLLACMLAALLNGVILPTFLSKFQSSLNEDIQILEIIVSYNFTLNWAFDYIFIVACCLSISIYSILMISSGNTFKWLGYIGLSLLVLAFAGLIFKFAFTSLIGFRFFTFSLSAWILATGVLLFRTKPQPE
ncbi:hypothetical protein [Roseivirga sp.]|uniref:hypothetical protein n=1 Tax=Roseivirga sp. TaxID=1964215 RepID=UPI003B517717